jgi:hypothetical protein
MTAAAAHLTKHARLGGSFKVRFEDDEKQSSSGANKRTANPKLDSWSISADKVSRIFNLYQQVGTTGGGGPLEERDFSDNCFLFQTVDLLFEGTDKQEVRQFAPTSSSSWWRTRALFTS